MIRSAYIEQAALALAVFGGCVALLVIGVTIGIIAVARLTSCTAAEASHALATVISAVRPRPGRLGKERATRPEPEPTAQAPLAERVDSQDGRLRA